MDRAVTDDTTEPNPAGVTPQGVIRKHIEVAGTVQGVGFRPYVHALATDLGLSGWVLNHTAGVTLEVQGTGSAVTTFGQRLPAELPRLASIEALSAGDVPCEADHGFEIRASTSTGAPTAALAPDVASCAHCLAEIADPSERRFGYAFTNCTNCGPRYSIVTDIPYDRPNTTMASFAMCVDCRREYEDPTDRRFHAQPVCCPACGPSLSTGIVEVADALRSGEIVAVKGLGGYHLVALASHEDAVARLRARKHREDKPFALMVLDVGSAGDLCDMSEAEAALLGSPAAPIVLLRRRAGIPVASGVAPGTCELGVMVAYTPLHHLLLSELGEPVVATSGNTSDEPIAYDDGDAASRLSPIADRFLSHNRRIHIRVEDSVARVIDDSPYLIRRSRGYAPAPLSVAFDIPEPVLACGADLKNTVAVGRDRHVFVSQHIGDLADAGTNRAFVATIAHLCRLYEIEPAVVAHDLHPQYHSSTHASEIRGVEHVAVQHHHAHIASALADAGHPGPVIGVAMDGMGYGDDGTIWGGEFLEADLHGYRRRAWFEPVPLPGGDAATREPWRMAAAYMQMLGGSPEEDLAVAQRHDRWADVVRISGVPAVSPLTSSVGRLFDAVAALIGVRDEVSYEGQAAIELERLVDPAAVGIHNARVVERDDSLVVQGGDLFTAALADLRSGVEAPAIATRFHRGLAATTAEVCAGVRDRTGLSTVALSGGVFLNKVLLTEVTQRLEDHGFAVLRHRRVPCNDGGISLGQVAVAAAVLRDRRA